MIDIVDPTIYVLYDVQKTALKNVNPTINENLTNPPGPQTDDVKKAGNLLRSFEHTLRPGEIPSGMHMAKIIEQIEVVTDALTRQISADALVVSPGRNMRDILTDIHKARPCTDLPQPNHDDHVTGWVWERQAQEAIRWLNHNGLLVGFNSGIYQQDEHAIAESIARQDAETAACVMRPYHFRNPLLDCTSLHKGIVHYAYHNMGKRTVMVEDDPPAGIFVANWVNIPAAIVSPRELAKSYDLVRRQFVDPNRARLDLVGDPGGGAVFRMGVEGNSQQELIHRCVAWWQEQDQKIVHQNGVLTQRNLFRATSDCV